MLEFLLIPGVILPFAGTTAPTGWLICDGTAVSRTTYANLFAATGTTFGVGNGTTTFNLPDLRGRSVLGAGTGSGLTARARGDTGGSETHQLTAAQMPSHTHTGTTVAAGGHSHTFNKSADSSSGPAGSNVASNNNTGAGTLATDAEPAHTHTFTTAGAGSDGSHPNMHPFVAVNHIVRT